MLDCDLLCTLVTWGGRNFVSFYGKSLKKVTDFLTARIAPVFRRKWFKHHSRILDIDGDTDGLNTFENPVDKVFT